MATSSFDVSTGADLQEVDNAVNQAVKEVQQRYDFKGTNCTIEFDRAKAEIRLQADDAFRMQQLIDIVQTRMVKRGVPIKNLNLGEDIKDGGFKKVQASIQGDEVRVTCPSRDELQTVIAFLRTEDFGIELKFGNYRG
jgi:uncharacterized protein YajQ (UPF0234 family)